jgi:S1-C subfamily serine protease
MSELQTYIFSRDIGDEIMLTVIRNNKEKQIKVIVDEKK